MKQHADPKTAPLVHRLFGPHSELGRLCRALDWAATPLGPCEQWSGALRGLAATVLASPKPKLLLWGPQLVQIYNDAYRALLGSRHPQALGGRASEGWVDFWRLSQPLFEQVIAKAEAFSCPDQRLMVSRGGDEQEAFFDLVYSPAFDVDGTVAGVLVTAQETTAARRAERQCDLERRRLETALELLPVGVRVADAGGQVIFANPAASAIWGARGPATGADSSASCRAWGADGQPLAYSEWGLIQALSGRATGPEELNIACADGTHKVVVSYGIPIRDSAGRLAGAVALSNDITQAKRAEAALRESQERFRALVSASFQTIYRMSADWGALLSQLGESQLELADCPCEDWLERYVPLEDRLRVLDEVADAIAGKRAYVCEHRVPLSDGSVGWMLSRAVPLLDAQGEIVEWFGAASEITGRKQAEQALRESEERYRSLFEYMDEGYCILEVILGTNGTAADCRFLEVNQSFARHTGLAAVRGRTVRELLPQAEPFWFETYGRVALTGEPTRFVIESPALDRWFDIYAFRVGEPARRQVAVLLNDISARRHAEEAQRVADRRKDEFLAMLGHELRNPLAAIHNTLWLLDRRIEEPQARDYLGIIGRQAGVLRGLVDDLLDVSRITRGLVRIKHERLDLVAIVRRALESLQALLAGSGHSVALELPERPVWVNGDAVRLEQVLTNLLTNAAKYTDAGGRISIDLVENADHALIRVADTGIGMKAEMLERVFELFGQAERGLDRAQGGLGIGLTIVKQLVELHGGSVVAESPGLGKGSIFTVRLPLQASALAETSEPYSQPPRPGRARHVLVVDDNLEIANTLARVLEQAGHRVDVAHDGPSALALADALGPEVVLLDIGLPVLNGYEVARSLRRSPRTCEALLVALTGYGQPADRERTEAAGFDAHFIKPVDLGALESFVARGGNR